MAETVKIQDTQSEARVAFDMAQWLWNRVHKEQPSTTAEAEQFLALVGQCKAALMGAETFNLKHVFG
ncbi:hypothetical protein OU426_04060 [Frigidibacter sp. RF13]|uniref:hypothetical protein n=1 Tax=Frigidibacter sp. RF13 TaxID=2997340 RepID=UPI002270DF1F|nr:hypothetical protein [Frigidibacter sp. RF13]MCY1126020.1 hypothetical protein [Frigidibacter sp. RF13]